MRSDAVRTLSATGTVTAPWCCSSFTESARFHAFPTPLAAFPQVLWFLVYRGPAPSRYEDRVVVAEAMIRHLSYASLLQVPG